jgi:hypothetical protein
VLESDRSRLSDQSDLTGRGKCGRIFNPPPAERRRGSYFEPESEAVVCGTKRVPVHPATVRVAGNVAAALDEGDVAASVSRASELSAGF